MWTRVRTEGYGPRGKSRWIIDAALDLIEDRSWETSRVAYHPDSKGVVPHPWKRIIVDMELFADTSNGSKEGGQLPSDIRDRLWTAAVDAMYYAVNQDHPIHIDLNVGCCERVCYGGSGKQLGGSGASDSGRCTRILLSKEIQVAFKKPMHGHLRVECEV